MPAKKSNKQNKKVKNNQKQLGQKGGIPPFFRPGPVVQIVDFAYSDSKLISESSSGVGAFNVYSLNSIWDPDVTGAGATALGYNMYSSSFTRYRVLRVRIFLDIAVAGGGPAICGHMCGPNSTISSVASTWPVQTNSYSDLLINANTGAKIKKIQRRVPLETVLGVTRQQFMTDFDYSSVFGSNPAKPAYLLCWVVSASGSAASAHFSVRIVYETELSQPLQSLFN